jgi:hypothetical protein
MIYYSAMNSTVAVLCVIHPNTIKNEQFRLIYRTFAPQMQMTEIRLDRTLWNFCKAHISIISAGFQMLSTN